MADDVQKFNELGSENRLEPAEGFRVSDQPVVQSNHPEEGKGSASADLPENTGTDLLYVIARDPKSLFVYWDLSWTRLFAQADLSPRQVYLRIYHADGSIEKTIEINPFRGHCYVDVAAPGTGYYCELGCFEEADWKNLLRSGSAVTPEAAMSDDLSAQFATLPVHLSFQRLLDIFRARGVERKGLSRAVAEIQENLQILREEMAPGDWSRLVAEVSASFPDGKTNGAEISALLGPVRIPRKPGPPTANEVALWKQFGEPFSGSSWGGASERKSNRSGQP
jgi:hypothetical protein